jgi:hypothetical protein
MWDIKRVIRSKRHKWAIIIWLGLLSNLCFGCITLWSNKATAESNHHPTVNHPSHSLEQIRHKYIQDRLQQDQTLNEQERQRTEIKQQLQSGLCRSFNYLWLTKKCSEQCILYVPKFRRSCKTVFGREVCVQVPDGTSCKSHKEICYPSRQPREVSICMYRENEQLQVTIDGQKSVLTNLVQGVDKLVHKLRSDYDQLEQKTKKLTHNISEHRQNLTESAKKTFARVEQSLTQQANPIAQSMAQSFQEKISTNIALQLMKQMDEARKKLTAIFAKQITDTLAQKSYEYLQQNTASQNADNSTNSFIERISALSILKIAALHAMKVVLRCWPYGDYQKKVCLKQAIASALQDAIFDVTRELLLAAIQVSILDDISQSMSVKIAKRLASSNIKLSDNKYFNDIIGFIAKNATNRSLRLIVFLCIEQLRPYYNKLYEQNILSPAQQWIDKLVEQLPDMLLKCPKPHKMCH